MNKETKEQTEDKILHLFKLHYTYYEGEHQSTILATTKEQNEIEKDLKEAVNSVKINRKEENLSDCVPEAWERVINILKQKGYVVCYFLLHPDYYVEEAGIIKGTKPRKYKILNLIEKTEWKRLR